MSDGFDPQSDTERRHFSRVAFSADTRLSQGSQTWHTELVDLSLKGLLVKTPYPWDGDLTRPFAASITLENGSQIVMSLSWRHTDDGNTGFVCEHIDIDSITHLRKLVELNLGDTALLERELASLGS